MFPLKPAAEEVYTAQMHTTLTGAMFRLIVASGAHSIYFCSPSSNGTRDPLILEDLKRLFRSFHNPRLKCDRIHTLSIVSEGPVRDSAVQLGLYYLHNVQDSWNIFRFLRYA